MDLGINSCFGDYAIDAGIVTVSSANPRVKGSWSHATRFSKRTFSKTERYIKRCIEIPPLGDTAVSPPKVLYLSKERSKGKGLERHKK
jgi:hypothetical protein